MARTKRWSTDEGRNDDRRRTTRNTLVALVLASASLMALDNVTGSSSPVEPVRRATGEVMGPVENVTAEAVRPFTSIGDYFRSRDALRDEVSQLKDENSALTERLATAGHDTNRLAEYDGLIASTAAHGQRLVPARVIGVGKAQDFTRTVTIDAGSRDGLLADQAVVNNDGLVGRIVRVTSTTATVVLLADARSTVGARISESSELGTVTGEGSVDSDGRLSFEMLDAKVVPAEGDTVLTWGDDGGPYPVGVPIGRIVEVYTSVRDTSSRAVLEPSVDFSALDVVGVVVPEGTRGDRAQIGPDGAWSK